MLRLVEKYSAMACSATVSTLPADFRQSLTPSTTPDVGSGTDGGSRPTWGVAHTNASTAAGVEMDIVIAGSELGDKL
jgi:hypothetical protein